MDGIGVGHNKKKNCAPQTVLALCLFLASGGFPAVSSAEVARVIVADPAAASFAVVVIADTPVLDATIRVFSDAEGTTEITSQVESRLTSADQPGMHARGIARFDLEDLSALTNYYVRLEVSQATGTITWPTDNSLLAVRTAATSRPVSASGQLDLNETLRHRVYRPTALAGGDDVLVTVSVPGADSATLAEFSTQQATTPAAYFELSNLTAANGNRLTVAPGAVLAVQEYHGLACGTSEQSGITRFRRGPVQTAAGQPLALRDAPACFAADTYCDGTVDVLDVQFLLNAWSRNAGDCGFNPDLDLVGDGTVDVLDLQSLLNQFGHSEPFP
jgi:hypothetical protein